VTESQLGESSIDVQEEQTQRSKQDQQFNKLERTLSAPAIVTATDTPSNVETATAQRISFFGWEKPAWFGSSKQTKEVVREQAAQEASSSLPSSTIQLSPIEEESSESEEEEPLQHEYVALDPLEESIGESKQIAAEDSVATPLLASDASNNNTKEAQGQGQVSPFEKKVRQLSEMGFNDKMRNIQLLLQNNGDMLETVKSLLE